MTISNLDLNGLDDEEINGGFEWMRGTHVPCTRFCNSATRRGSIS